MKPQIPKMQIFFSFPGLFISMYFVFQVFSFSGIFFFRYFVNNIYLHYVLNCNLEINKEILNNIHFISYSLFRVLWLVQTN